jgi:hypothetical protein
MTEATEKRPPPYLAHALYARFITQLEDVGIPRQIDKSVFPTLSSSTSSSLLRALRYLNLVGSDGVPTTTLIQLITEREKADVLAKIVRGAYSFVFKDLDDLTSAHAEELENRFRDQHLSGGTISKAVAFFISLALDANIPIAPRLIERRHPARSRTIRSRRVRTPETPASPRPPTVGEPTTTAAPPPPLACDLYGLLDTDRMTPKEQQAILTILLYLKKKRATLV